MVLLIISNTTLNERWCITTPLSTVVWVYTNLHYCVGAGMNSLWGQFGKKLEEVTGGNLKKAA